MTVCPANTIDSNITGLAVAEEICPGVLPNMDDDGYLPTWFEQEPNSYPTTFGGTLKTVARAPIKQNRQRSKGTPVDLDASGGWNTDYTASNLTRQLQGFFFASAREKTTTAPLNSRTPAVITDVTTDTFNGSDFPRFRPADIVALKGSPSSNGAYTVSTATDTDVLVVETIPDATLPDTAALSVVGKQFAAGAVAVTVAGEIGTLHLGAAPVAGTSTLTLVTAKPSDGETVTIGTQVYTFRDAPSAPFEVLIGGAFANSAVNLTGAINGLVSLNGPNPDVIASNGSAGVVIVTARLKGASENSVVTTETLTNGSWNHTTLTGGTGFSMHELGMIPGEWGFLGGDGAGNHFANNIGYFRVGSITDTDIVMDQTTWGVEAEAAGALTIRLYTGTVIQNEDDPDLIITRSYNLQRTLGKDATGTQSQYIEGSVCNELTINMPLTSKLTVDLSFAAMRAAYRTGADGLKDGDLVAAPNEPAINSSNAIYEAAMYVLDDSDSNPSRLFGYLTDATIKVANNASINKGLGVLGGIGVNVGIFEVSGTATAYFQNVAANIAINDNADVGCYFIIAQQNKGFIYDQALLTLGGGDIKIETNKPITVPLTTDAAQNKNGSTLVYTNFEYLPTLAMPVAA